MVEGAARAEGIRLLTERLCIREYRPEDMERHHGLISDPGVMRYIQDVFSSSREESAGNLKNAIEESRKGTERSMYFFVISDKDAEEYMGGIGYTKVKECPAGSQAEIGYFLYPEFWGRGYASEALRAVIKFAFEEGGVYRMNGTCIAENEASARVMESCGFVKEAVLKDVQWHEDALKDRYLYRLLRSEYRAERF